MLKQISAALALSALSFSAFAQNEGISVSGSVSKQVEPDEMIIQFSVSTEEEEIQDAFTGTEQKSAAIIEYLQSLDELCEVSTQHISLGEQFEWTNGRAERVRVGFTASQSLQVKLKDFDLYPIVMAKLIELGVNNVGGVSFSYSGAQDLRNSMRVEAIQIARSKASEVAEALDVQLGSAVEFTEAGSPSFRQRAELSNSFYLADGEQAEGSISPGKQTIRMEVHVRFAILAPQE
ncbi:MAG: SIMPL domain-containing protein [Flavobacteriia bacterium]|nr:SIMPL domain-containing protein [Flavobacteriia bacterium]